MKTVYQNSYVITLLREVPEEGLGQHGP
jgi:hypothetical protein